MSVARRIPVLGILSGIALLIVGFINSNTGLIIVGVVLLALGLFRQIRVN